MLSYGTSFLKAIIPAELAENYLADSSTSHANNNNSTMEDKEILPLTPFCCVSAIPSSLRYVVELLPASTTHNVLARPLTSTPLIAAFLAYITNCYHRPGEPCAKDLARPAASNMYFAIVQLIIIDSAVQKAADKEKNKLGLGHSHSSANSPSKLALNRLPRTMHDTPRRSSATVAGGAGSSKWGTAEEGFSDIALDSGPSSYQSVSKFTALLVSSPQKVQDATGKEVHYFAPVENSRENTILHETQRLKGGKAWKEISETAALESLRLPGCGINIGDGEEWRELEGVESMVCRGHKKEFEIRVWIRET